jgi:hypothetical protein
MANFIEHDGESQLPPPYRFPGVSINSFRLEGTLKAVQALCDQFLNIDAVTARGSNYVAASQYVDLEILKYPRMECTQPPFSDHGFCAQNEMYFRVLVARYDAFHGMNILFPSEIGWFIPFIFVDNPWSLVSGREVIALSKNLASFELGPSGSGPYPIKVSAHVLDPYDPNTCLSPKRIVEIGTTKRARSKIPAGPWPWGDMDFTSLSIELQDFLRGLGVFSESKLTIVGLKQFRDAQNPTTACYQALVQSEFNATNTEINELSPADVTLSDYRSLPIMASLGFPGLKLTPVWQYNMKCDLTFGSCRNIFVA